MVAVVKSEWHQVEKRYIVELERTDLDEIYPDAEPDELDLKYILIQAGKINIQEVMNDAREQDICLDWEWMDEDDWWTDRKGGYEVTYAIEP